jgi:uncharacterized protein YllA (UPF0747 family)
MTREEKIKLAEAELEAVEGPARIKYYAAMRQAQDEFGTTVNPARTKFDAVVRDAVDD